jgi:trigger factor
VVGVEIGAPIPDVPVKLGDRHPNKKLRNRTIVYRVQLEGLSEKVLPTVTDEFVATVLPDVGTVAALREKFRQELELVADSEARSLVQAEILSKLLEANQFEVPQPLIDEEIMNMLLRGGVLDPMRIDIRKVDISRFRDGLGEVALRRVRSAIVVDRIGEAEKILATPDEVAEALKDIAEETGRSLDTVKNDYSGSRGRGLVIELTRDKVLEFLTARAVITYTEPPPVEAATPSSESPEGGETVASGG